MNQWTSSTKLKWISIEAIEEIGLCRIKDICAWCREDMDIENYNIQLCRKCRMKQMNKLKKEQDKENGSTK